MFAMCVHSHLHVYFLYTYIVSACVYMCICVFMYVRIFMSVCVCMHVRKHVHMIKQVCTCIISIDCHFFVTSCTCVNLRF